LEEHIEGAEGGANVPKGVFFVWVDVKVKGGKIGTHAVYDVGEELGGGADPLFSGEEGIGGLEALGKVGADVVEVEEEGFAGLDVPEVHVFERPVDGEWGRGGGEIIMEEGSEDVRV
jgi:hypothetical protein